MKRTYLRLDFLQLLMGGTLLILGTLIQTRSESANGNFPVVLLCVPGVVILLQNLINHLKLKEFWHITVISLVLIIAGDIASYFIFPYSINTYSIIILVGIISLVTAIGTIFYVVRNRMKDYKI